MVEPKPARALADQFLLVHDRWFFASHWATSSIAHLADIQLQLSNGPAECITMHAKFAGRFALVPTVLLQDVQDEALFEFTHGFRIKNAAAIHLRYECFELVLHRVSSLSRCANLLSRYIYLFVAPGLGPPRSLMIPARNFWRTSEGASQLAPRPATRK